MNWQPLFDQLADSGLDAWADQLATNSADWLTGHGDYPRWRQALDSLPEIADAKGLFNEDALTIAGNCTNSKLLRQALQGLMPWRKGPFRFADIDIDSEWRSNLKWRRVLPHLTSLEGRRILDIGCGNGYYAWRMLSHRPELVLGIEPSVLFNLQFWAVQHYLQQDGIHVLPLRVEDLPRHSEWFHTVFSMGVLYHRRSPIDHLYQLKEQLTVGGELCLETLVISGEAGQVLMPRERYARMRNVWFIPSAPELIRWVQRCGFVDVRLVDENVTTVDEQRTTEWMQFESLAAALNPENLGETIEGLPAPRRAVIMATKP